MSLSPAAAEAVKRLTEAQMTGAVCRPVRDLLEADIGSAYVVQTNIVDARVALGHRVVGRKIGLTNLKVQEQLGVAQPDFGVLHADMAWAEDDPVDMALLIQPKIEAEIAFVLSADLDLNGPISVTQVRNAISYACAALEIVDSRIADWDISIVDTVADNASSGLYVLGDRHVRIVDFDPVSVSMTLRKDGVLVSSGTGADCLGDPLRAVAWLAETVRDLGRPLRAGEVILSGALGPMVTVQPGSCFTAEVSGLGSVHADFGAVPARGGEAADEGSA